MTLTAPGCGMGEVLVADVRDKLKLIPTMRNVDVELVFDPPWNQSMMSEAARLQTGMMYGAVRGTPFGTAVNTSLQASGAPSMARTIPKGVPRSARLRLPE